MPKLYFEVDSIKDIESPITKEKAKLRLCVIKTPTFLLIDKDLAEKK